MSDDQLAALEARVAALEEARDGAGSAASGPSTDPASAGAVRTGAVGTGAVQADAVGPEAVPTAAAEPGASGVIGYQGAVHLAGDVSWTIRYDAAATLELPAGPVAEVLAALGHPVRLAIVRRLLAGPASAAELAAAAELSSTGQLYHHLRSLTAARLVEQDGRRYRVPTTGVVPVLVAILAAADLGGRLA